MSSGDTVGRGTLTPPPARPHPWRWRGHGGHKTFILLLLHRAVNEISQKFYNILNSVLCYSWVQLDCYNAIAYMSQMLYAGQSAREIVTFLSDF